MNVAGYQQRRMWWSQDGRVLLLLTLLRTESKLHAPGLAGGQLATQSGRIAKSCASTGFQVVLVLERLSVLRSPGIKA